MQSCGCYIWYTFRVVFNRLALRWDQMSTAVEQWKSTKDDILKRKAFTSLIFDMKVYNNECKALLFLV